VTTSSGDHPPVVTTRQRYRLGRSVGLPVWGWILALAFLTTALIGLVLDLTGHGDVGHWIAPVGYVGATVCAIIAHATERR
jgi:hypothetical protein